MPKTNLVYSQKLLTSLRRQAKKAGHFAAQYWRKNLWHKIWISFVIFILICIGVMYGISRWYAYSVRNQPYTMGVTFVPDYATYLGLNPEKTMDALINDLHVKNFRLVGYWSDIEPTKGHYDFSQLDWEFQKADAAHAKISLSLGLRQPRWPECHAPSWVNTSAPESQWQPELESFISAVVNRYKNNLALQSYQLENEYFNKSFGTCANYSRARLVSEFNLVKKLDPRHQIILTRSNSYGGLAIGKPTADTLGIEVYRRVWAPQTNSSFEYPFPAWYYGFLAGAQKILTGKSSIITEFQAEPWLPNGKTVLNTSLSEQNQTFDAKDFESYFKFAQATGMRSVYFWGAEYWYYRLTVLHDPSVWNVAKQNFNKQN